ncbi:MAG: methyltransferase [Terriglobia bacterium]|nr:MAG: methyltransferase [Terriglobia bacterium]
MPRLRTWLRRLLQAVMERCGMVRFDTRRYYAEDGLFSVHNDEFRQSPTFRDAYTRGIEASAGVDPEFAWRVHVALWAARAALSVPGDFVECGVNAGFMSSAIMRRLNWSEIPRRFFLIDTFAGPVFEQFSAEELEAGKARLTRELLSRGAYVTDVERARRNFAEWVNAIVVAGPVPDILPSLEIERVAFLHIDMNCAYPERSALQYFWDRLSPGALVLFDDYANHEYRHQKQSLDEAARSLGTEILSLPTGQGLAIR